MECIEEAVGILSISCKFKFVLDQFIWAFSRVYGSNADSEKHYLWEELSRVFSWWEVPWCIGREFNVTCFPNERVGVTQITFAMWEFSEQGLMDIPLAGGSFTWSNTKTSLCPKLIDL
jgi:hypothetical protein